MSSFFRIQVIFLACVSSVKMGLFRSSYFKISPEGVAFTEQDISTVRQAHDEFSCALLCGSTDVCSYAVFDSDSKKCSLVKAKIKPNRQDNQEAETRTILLEKVDISLSNKTEGLSPEKNSTSTTHGRQRNNSTTATSCSDIQRKGSYLTPGGVYNITIGDVTWRTKCKMTGIGGCGEGAWTLVMRISGYKRTFHYDSHHWTSKTSHRAVEEGAENKLPGYWLSPFRKLCISMNFPQVGKINNLLNNSAKSLYSLLHEGISTTWTGGHFVTKPSSPFNIDKSCLVWGFNIQGAQPWFMKSRVGAQSQSKKCGPPYVLRGVGIGVQGKKLIEISCGEIHVNKDLSIKEYPAICKIYVQ